MKGFQQDTGNKVLYLGIKHHSIVEESKKEREGFEPVKVVLSRSGEEITKFVRRYRFIRAFVNKIEYKDTKEQFDFRFQSWRLHLTDEDGDQAILEIPLTSGVGSRFMKLAENVDWKQLVEFRAWHDTNEDKTAFTVKQNGNNVPQLYTRENPGTCPQPVQRGRQNKWDYTEQEDFLFERMMTVVIPEVERVEASRVVQRPAEPQPNGHAPTDDEWNDQF